MISVCITGGAGFLGSHLVDELLVSESIYAVKVLSRQKCPLSKIKNSKFSTTTIDWNCQKSIEETFKDVDVVIHCAANHPTRREAKNLSVMVDNVRLMECVLRGLSKPVHLITISSMRALVSRHKKIINEDVEYNFATEDTTYGASKYLSDKITELWFSIVEGVRLTIIYPGIIIGPDDVVPSPNGQDFFRVMRRYLNFYMDAIYPIVDVRDVARAVVICATSKDVGKTSVQKFLLCGHNISMHDYYKLIKRAQGNRFILCKIPFTIAQIASNFFKLISTLNPSFIPPIAGESLAYAKLKLRFDGSRAKNFFGEYTSIEKTVLDTVRFFENEK